MKKKLLQVIVLLLMTFCVMGQTGTEDVIYLRNGGVIRGRILPISTVKGELNATSSTKIELTGGSVFVFQPNEIDSIKKEDNRKNRLKEIRTNYYRKDKGFRNMTEFGILYGTGHQSNNNYNYYYNNGTPDDIGISLHTINGYQFWPYLFVGGGVGIERYITYQQTFSPFYCRIASEFLKKKVTPYVYLDAGYSVMWQQFRVNADGYAYYKNTGGFYLSAGGGVRVYTNSRASVLISLAYKRNSSESNWAYLGNYDFNTYDIKRTYQRLVMNIGVTF